MSNWDVPSEILTDSGKEFIGTWWENMCALLGVNHVGARVYDHRALPAVRAGRNLINMLRNVLATEKDYNCLETIYCVLRRYHRTKELHTYDFSSCFFPKFKKSTKRGFSREMTYFFGFYGTKIGRGGPPTRMLSKNIKNPENWPILGYFCLLGAGPAEQCCTPVHLPIEDFRQEFQFSLHSPAPK